MAVSFRKNRLNELHKHPTQARCFPDVETVQSDPLSTHKYYIPGVGPDGGSDTAAFGSLPTLTSISTSPAMMAPSESFISVEVMLVIVYQENKSEYTFIFLALRR